MSADNKEEAEHFSLRTAGFVPDAFYSITVRAVSRRGGYGKELTKTFEIEAGCKSSCRKTLNIIQSSHVSVPNLTKMKTSEITIEASAKTARLTIPNSVFKSDVGKIKFILLLIEEIVSDFREQKVV